MGRYIVKRMLLFLPTIFIITLLVFYLNSLTPGDPAEILLESGKGDGQRAENIADDKSYQELRTLLGLDLPLFYFSIQPLSLPDTLSKIANKNHRAFYKMLCQSSGNQATSYTFMKKLLLMIQNSKNWKTDNNAEITQFRYDLENILGSTNSTALAQNMKQIERYVLVSSGAGVSAQFASLNDAYSKWKTQKTTYKNYIPVLRLHTDNQYHRWLFGNGRFSKGILKGDFGISYQDKRRVSSILPLRIGRTLLISFISIVLSYLIALPLGIYTARNQNTWKDKSIGIFLFVLYSLPTFWVASLLIIFFAGGDYYDFFPSYGLGEIPKDATFFEKLSIRFYHLILPVFCWTYTGLAFLSRQMRGAMVDNFGLDYIRTARAKGLSEAKVANKHNFRNALLPLITLFADVFPSLIAGSVVLEVIFSIPGMGKLAFDAIIAKDFPILLAIVLISSLLTILGYLIADILYFFVDPRIKTQFSKS